MSDIFGLTPAEALQAYNTLGTKSSTALQSGSVPYYGASDLGISRQYAGLSSQTPQGVNEGNLQFFQNPTGTRTMQDFQLPYQFVQNGYSPTTGSVQSLLGTGAAQPNQFSISPTDQGRYVTYDQLKQALVAGGHLPGDSSSAQTTPGTYQNPGGDPNKVAQVAAQFGIKPDTTPYPGTYGSSTYNMATGGLTLKPTVMTSENARTQTTQNQNTLSNYNSSLPPGTTVNSQGMTLVPNTPAQNAAAGGTQGTGAITATSTNPAFQSIIGQANQIISQFQAQGGQLDATSQALLSQINGFQDQKTSLIGKANDQATNGDAKGLNTTTQQLKNLDAQQNETITKLQAQLPSLRNQQTTLLNKSADETTVETQLADLRNQATVDKILTESQQIPLGAITGQNAEKMKLYLAQETNLLTRLGLAQDARKIQQSIVDNKISGIKDDINIQLNVNQELRAQQDQVLQQASTLSTIQKNTLATIADTFKDVDLNAPENAQVKLQLQQMAVQAGVDASLAMKAWESSYNQNVFDNHIKTRQENIAQQNANSSSKNADTKQTTMTGEELKQAINKAIATDPGWSKLSDAQKAQYIQAQGGTPSDFGL